MEMETIVPSKPQKRALFFESSESSEMASAKMKDRNYALAKALAEHNADFWAVIHYPIHSRYHQAPQTPRSTTTPHDPA